MSKENAVQQKITDQRAWLNWMEIGVFDAPEIEEVLDVPHVACATTLSTSLPSGRVQSTDGEGFVV